MRYTISLFVVAIAATASAAVPSPSSTPEWEVHGTETFANLGWMVAVVDTNGDGYDDVLAAGADRTGIRPYFDFAPYVRVYYGSPTGPAKVPDLELPGVLDTPPLLVGDFHGDGYGDVLLADRVYEGSATGLVSPGIPWGPAPYKAAVGDFDGDGDDDLATTVMFPEFVEITLGGPAGLAASPSAWLPVPPYAGASCGGASLHALDADADGDDDLAVSCMAGVDLLLYEGDPSGLTASQVTVISPTPTLMSSPNLMLQASGDLNADGFPDLVVADPLAIDPSNGSRAGFVMVLAGGFDGLDAVPIWETFGRYDAQQGSQLGWGGVAGDFEGDGDDDLFLGAPRTSNPELTEGAIEAFFGESSGLSGPIRLWEPNESLAYFGTALAIGDLDANGSADLVVGANELDTSKGGVFAFFSDVDKDGVGVGDCDDSDPTVHTGAAEVVGDGVDQDCDGLDALLGIADLSPGDLVISEVMRDPAAVSAEAGQWFEVLVQTSAPVDLVGLSVSADGQAAIEDFFVIEPGDRFVVGRAADPQDNGGVDVQLVFPELAIEGWIGLADDDRVLVGLDVSALPQDRGASASLAPDADPSLVTDPVSWCSATSSYGLGDLGTPGLDNDPCVVEVANISRGAPGEEPEGAGFGCAHTGAPWSVGALLVPLLCWRRRGTAQA